MSPRSPEATAAVGAALEPVIELTWLRGALAPTDAPADLILEVPHGATATADFARVERQLTSALPTDLVDFFHVNTDAGAPELALATAASLVAAEPRRTAVVARCRIPRTFIDCNRQLDASPADFAAGKVTQGLPPWITTARDRALLRDAYDRYQAAVAELVAAQPADGAMLLVHSYAPRTVDVQVDLHIVESLRRAYLPEVEPTWPMRPPLDLIRRDAQGTDHAPAAVVAALDRALAPLGLAAADSATYPLHPSTIGHAHVVARPGRVLCLEVRRDLLADPFEPFAQMHIGAAKIERLAAALTAAARAFW